MQRILGIDPGLVATGYAVIESDGRAGRLLTSGVINTNTRSSELPARLGAIFDGLVEIIRQHRPQAASVEQVFVHRNASSALKLGQARGVAVCAAVTHQVPVYEYSARTVKQSVVGKGNANKEQVQFMVARLLQIASRARADEADAMAIALCHAFTSGAKFNLARAAVQ